jgi:hypothetical protein
MEEMYAPPISLNGFHGKSLNSFPPKESSPISFVSETRKYDFKTSLEYRTFLKINRNHSLPGFLTKLTVRIPKSRDHPFWKQPFPGLSESEIDIAELSFQVERWGISAKVSLHYAVQRARDIIACIRMAVSGKIEVVNLVGVQLHSPFTIPQNPVLRLGHELTDLWKRYPQSPSGSEDLNSLNALLQTKIDSNSHIQIHLLLQYYQVCSQLYLH